MVWWGSLVVPTSSDERKERLGAPHTTTPFFLESKATMADSGSAQPLKAPSESRCAANVANTAAWSGCLVVSGERLMTRAFRATAKSAAAVPSGSPQPQAVHVALL